jgi:GxxExxY protein
MIDIVKIKSEMYDVVGAIYEVHKELGAGLNEYCYQEGLAMELIEQGIPFQREMSFHPTYHGQPMNAEYRIDFLCKENVIVECKAVSELTNNHRAQLFNYMRLQKKSCGILVNFSPKFADVERYAYDAATNRLVDMNGNLVQNVY